MSREDYDYEDEEYFEEEWFEEEEEDLDDLLESEEANQEDIIKKLVEADKDRMKLSEKSEEIILNEELKKRRKELEKSRENFFNPDDLVL